MGLFDMFKRPEYKSKDINIRKRAVKDLKDENILVNIVNDDNEDYYVRAYALKNIENENTLKEIIPNLKGYSAKFLKRIAFINIHDENWLKDYFNKIEYDDLTKVCLIRCIHDNSILQDFVFNSRPFLNNKLPLDVHVNLAALENITDDKVLLNIVNNHFSIFLKEKALLKIKDQNILKKFAQDDSNRRLKIAAIRNPFLNDVDFLKEISENEEDELICKLIENRCNQNISNNSDINDGKIENEKTNQDIIDTAYNDIDEFKRRDAVKEIHDKEILEDLMQKEISDTVLMVIYSKLSKEHLLKDIALKGRYDGEKALELIDNPFILEDIVLLKPYDSLGFKDETRIKVLKRLIYFDDSLDFIYEYSSNDTVKLIIYNKRVGRQCSHCYSYRVVHDYNEMSEYLKCHDCGKRTFL